MWVRSWEFHKFYLGVTAFVLMALGPLFTLGSAESTSDPIRTVLSMLASKPMSYAELTTRFISALAGGLLFCWAATIWCLRCWVYDAAPNAIRRCVRNGAIVSCAFDSAGCALAGVYANIPCNLLFLFLAVGPLWFPAEEDSRSSAASKASLLQQS